MSNFITLLPTLLIGALALIMFGLGLSLTLGDFRRLLGHPPLHGRTLDVGLGGMGLLLPHALPGGLNCRVRFSLFIQAAIHHFDLPAQTVASVFLRDDVRLSLRFTQVPPASAKLLGDYVRFQLS